MSKELTVELTIAWTFTQKDWKEHQEFLESVKDNPKIVLGYDIKNTFYSLNDIVPPELKDMKVTELC